MRLSFAVLLCALALPASASADVVVTSATEGIWEEIAVQGDDAANHITTSRTEGILYIEEATGQTVTDAADSCTQEGPRVRCADPDPDPWSRISVTVHGAGGADELTDSAARIVPGFEFLVVLHGDAGDDTMLGNTFTAQSGGEGNDRMEGRFGGSASGVGTGGPGDDVLNGTHAAGKLGYNYWVAEPGADLYVTKPNDFFDYSHGGAPVSLSLDAQPNDGRPGEGDNIGNQAWQIVGTPFGDRIDIRTAQEWGVRVFAGAGDDAVLGSGMQDRLDCGDGTDAAEADASDELTACETVTPPPGPAPPAPPAAERRPPFVGISSVRVVRRRARVRAVVDEAVTLAAEVRSGGRRVGRATLPSAAGAKRFEIRLRRGVRLARTLTITVTATDAAGNATTRTRRIRLR